MLHPPVAAHGPPTEQPQHHDSANPASIVRRKNVKINFIILRFRPLLCCCSKFKVNCDVRDTDSFSFIYATPRPVFSDLSFKGIISSIRPQQQRVNILCLGTVLIQRFLFKREQLLNRRVKLDHNISMIQEVFSSGIERGCTKRVATLILIVSFSPDVLHQRPIQAVHLLAERLYLSTLCQTKHILPHAANATQPEYTCTQPQHTCTGVQQRPGQIMTLVSIYCRVRRILLVSTRIKLKHQMSPLY